MIIIHAADIHLGSTLAGLDRHEGLPAELIRSAPLTAFERIADECRDRDAKLLLIAGDLFDKAATVAVIRQATNVLKRISERGTNVVMLRGNHDALSKMRLRLPDLDRVHELPVDRPDTVELDIDGERVVVHGRGFDSPHVTENIVETYPARINGAFNIGMLHTSLGSSNDVYAPCAVDDLVAHGYDYWALGHIHQHAAVRPSDPPIIYAGSPQGRDIGECGEHGMYVLDVEAGQLVGEPTHVELASVRWHQVPVDLDGLDGGVDEVVAVARDAIEHTVASCDTNQDVRHVVRIRLEGRCDAHVAMIEGPELLRDAVHVAADGVGGATVHVERVVIATTPPLPDPSVLHARPDAIGVLAVHLETSAIERSEDMQPPVPPPFLDKLDARLKKLGADGAHLRDVSVSDVEVADAAEDLLARLVAASSQGAEAAR